MSLSASNAKILKPNPSCQISGMTQNVFFHPGHSISSRIALCFHHSRAPHFNTQLRENELVSMHVSISCIKHTMIIQNLIKYECPNFNIGRYRASQKLQYPGFKTSQPRTHLPHDLHLQTHSQPSCT